MLCSCGQACDMRQSVRKKIRAVYTFWRCKACGRIEPEALKVDGQIQSRGWRARSEFLAIEDLENEQRRNHAKE